MNKSFFYFYYFLLIFIFFLSIPFLLLLLLIKTKYRESFFSIFFLFKNKKLKPNGIWFHASSFGEIRSLFSLIDNFNKELVRVTTTTKTGIQAIKSKISESRYLPFEIFLPFWINHQKTLIVMEAELWYMLFYIAKKKGIKTILINARIGPLSFKKKKKFSWFYKKVFENIDEIYAQNISDKEYLELLGAKNVQVIGNIKLASIISKSKNLIKPKELLVCGASTHDKEEILILQAFLDLKRKNPLSKLVIAPRHPERFDFVSKMVQNFAIKNKLSFSKYSETILLDKDIIILDVLGELINIYSISDIVILGGSFVKVGGHNPAEAVQFNCKIISGSSYFNQQDIFKMISGIKIINKSEELSKTLSNFHLLKNTKIINTVTLEPIIKSISLSLESS